MQVSNSSETPTTSAPLPSTSTGAHAEPETRVAFLPIQRILCPVDFSDWSRAALHSAVALAGATNAEIIGLFVAPCVLPVASQEETSPCAEEADAAMMSAMAEDLEEFLRPAEEAGLTVRVRVKRGDCVQQILEEARDARADIIVMGTHGRSGFQRWVLGSVTDGVLRKAPCPVLAVPRREVRGTAEERQS